MRATSDDDDDGGFAEATPPGHGKIIDQFGNDFSPPPPPQRRSHLKQKSNVERGREMLRGCGQ
jgi:hypothetical protein